MKNFIFFTLIVILSLFSSFVSFGEETSSATLLIQKGIELYENGDYEESLKLFDRGLGIIDEEEALIRVHKYLALNYIAFNIKEKAYQEFKKIFLMKPDFKLEGSFSPVVMEIYELARKDTSVKGQLEITSDPEGADIYLNGKFMGKTPFKKEIFLGKYSLKVMLFGYQTFSKTFVMNSMEMTLGNIELSETDFFSRFKKGKALYQQGNYKAALNNFYDVLSEFKEFPDAFIMIGSCYTKIPGMEFEGIEWIKVGIDKATDKIEGYKSLFDAYWNVGDYKASLSTLNLIESLELTSKSGDWINYQRLKLGGLGYK